MSKLKSPRDHHPPGGNHSNANDSSHANSNPAAVSAAIVSILHNVANVFRDAGNPTKALRVLVEAQNTLLASEQDLLKVGTRTEGVAIDHNLIPTVQVQHDCHHCWHQAARLSTAIGHIYYESEAWRDAREAYGESLVVYERLLRSLSRQSDRLGWSEKEQQRNRNAAPLSCGNPEQDQKLELLHHQQSIQREVSVLEKDLDELDRRQQARDGSRTRLLQARRQQQQQQQQQNSKQRHDAARRMSKQQHSQQQSSLFGIVSNLRA